MNKYSGLGIVRSSLSLNQTSKFVSLERENTGNRLCAKMLINLWKMRRCTDTDGAENSRNYFHN